MAVGNPKSNGASAGPNSSAGGGGAAAGGSASKAVAQPPPTPEAAPHPPGPQVVGPDVQGNREVYQLVRRLQSALFGGVYEARGMSTGRDFAIKVLHKSELDKAQSTNSIEFCEVPLSEIRFAELMRGSENVMETEDHFSDEFCFYVVFELCRGGDLLEALKQKPRGFIEREAQMFIKQAAKGLAYLHGRRVAMQDVSLENMLLHVQEATGHFQVKVCDPGQAALFEVDHNGEELPVKFTGLVGKSFRPPELHNQRPYLATKVDSWCLGWSTFYLLTAQPLFMSADPANHDADWLLFQSGQWRTLISQKTNWVSEVALEFICRLMQIDPAHRMSIAEALDHPWLKDPAIGPVLAPVDLLPESLLKSLQVAAEAAPAPAPVEEVWQPNGQVTASPKSLPVQQQQQQPMLRVQSPGPLPRSPRHTAATGAPRAALDHRRSRGRQMHMQGTATRLPYVVATAHSPAPVGVIPLSPAPRPQTLTRTASPLQGSVELGQRGMVTTVPHQLRQAQAGARPQIIGQDGQTFYQPAFMTPRMVSRPRSPAVKGDLPDAVVMGTRPHTGDAHQPAWAFRAVDGQGGDDGTDPQARAVRVASNLPMPQMAMQMVPMSTSFPSHRVIHQSPPRTHGTVCVQPRSLSPVQLVPAPAGLRPAVAAAGVPPPGSATMPPAGQRPASPVQFAVRPNPNAFTWPAVAMPMTISPRAGSLSPTAAVSRTGSPLPMVASPVAMPSPMGFSFNPDPPSPRILTRTMSPTPVGAITFPKQFVLGAPPPASMMVPRR